MENQHQNLFDLQVDQEVSGYLAETAKWAKFLSIVGFVMTGLMVILSFFAGAIMTFYASAMGAGEAGMPPMAGGFFTVIYLLFALLIFFPYLYLYNFANKMQAALRSSNQEELTKSFANLKSCFKFVGVLTLICLAFYALAFVIGLIAGLAGAAA
jgi:hypothetical protein